MDAQLLTQLAEQHKHVLLAALIIGFVVRLLKSDTKIPFSVPPRLRIWLAFGLGVVTGVLEKVASGTPWKSALADGLFAAALAVLGQNVVVDSLRGGKEFGVPGLMVPGAPPSPGKPPSVPPPPAVPPLPVLFLLLLCLLLPGCAKFFRVADFVADKAKCVVDNQDLPDREIWLKCAVEPGDIHFYADLLSSARGSTKRALERAGASPLPADAGAPAADGGGK